jgi:penicillin-binding protein 2
MQLCVYTSTLANKGTRYRATFLNRVVSADYRELLYSNEKEVLSYMEISDDAFAAYKQGMIEVAHNAERGTARSTFSDYPITIAAKTGTAETGLNIGSDNGAFICFAPAENPRIAIAVYGERAGHGSSMAAVAKAILDSYFEVGEAGDVAVYENQIS